MEGKGNGTNIIGMCVNKEEACEAATRSAVNVALARCSNRKLSGTSCEVREDLTEISFGKNLARDGVLGDCSCYAKGYVEMTGDIPSPIAYLAANGIRPASLQQCSLFEQTNGLKQFRHVFKGSTVIELRTYVWIYHSSTMMKSGNDMRQIEVQANYDHQKLNPNNVCTSMSENPQLSNEGPNTISHGELLAAGEAKVTTICQQEVPLASFSGLLCLGTY